GYDHRCDQAQSVRRGPSIPNFDASNTTLRQRRSQHAETLGQIQQWLQAPHLVATKAWCVHGSGQVTFHERSAYGLRDLQRDVLLGLSSRGAEVRRQDDVVKRSEWMVRG